MAARKAAISSCSAAVSGWQVPASHAPGARGAANARADNSRPASSPNRAIWPGNTRPQSPVAASGSVTSLARPLPAGSRLLDELTGPVPLPPSTVPAAGTRPRHGLWPFNRGGQVVKPAMTDLGPNEAENISSPAAPLQSLLSNGVAHVSYRHAYVVLRAHGESGITAQLESAPIDGRVYASGMIIRSPARHRMIMPLPDPLTARAGIAAARQRACGWSHGSSEQ
jgi:hypothetical protein